MARRENWFKHDLDSRMGLKMAAFFEEVGAEGYGLFWLIIETLYRTDGHRLANSSKTWQMLAIFGKASKVENVVNRLIELGLFELANGHFFSPRVLEELKIKDEKYQDFSDKRAVAGRAGGLAKASKASERRSDQIRSNTNISLPVAYLADQEEQGSKTDIDPTPEDPLLEIARAKLVPPNGTHPWESSNPFILTGRQPLRRFPEVFLSPTELRDVIALYDGAGIEHLLAHAFKAVVGRLQQMKMDGKDTARAPCCSWLIGWAYQEQLENHNKTLRIEKTKRPYEQR